MSISRSFQGFLGWLLFNFKDLEHKQFTKEPVFARVSEAIRVDCPELDSSGQLFKKHAEVGDKAMPDLTWQVDDENLASSIKEFVVVCQDIDVPVPRPVLHSSIYGIPGEARSLSNEQVKSIDNTGAGMKYGKNLYGNAYVAPHPILNHGPHRYVYQVIGLDKSSNLPAKAPFARVRQAVQGKVVAYGAFTATYERRLDRNDD